MSKKSVQTKISDGMKAIALVRFIEATMEPIEKRLLAEVGSATRNILLALLPAVVKDTFYNYPEYFGENQLCCVRVTGCHVNCFLQEEGLHVERTLKPYFERLKLVGHNGYAEFEAVPSMTSIYHSDHEFNSSHKDQNELEFVQRLVAVYGEVAVKDAFDTYSLWERVEAVELYYERFFTFLLDSVRLLVTIKTLQDLIDKWASLAPFLPTPPPKQTTAVMIRPDSVMKEIKGILDL